MAVVNAEPVRANLALVRGRIERAAARAGRRGSDVEILAAVKYVGVEDIETLVAAGVTLVGENRAQELLPRRRAHRGCAGTSSARCSRARSS